MVMAVSNRREVKSVMDDTPPLSPDSSVERTSAEGDPEVCPTRDENNDSEVPLGLLRTLLPVFPRSSAHRGEGGDAGDAGGRSTTEESPLLRPRNNELETREPSTPAKSSWKSLSGKISRGELLLYSQNSTLGDDAKSKKRQDREAAIRNAMEFTLTECLVAILVYILVAVVAFSFVFDHWSIIDSCYFAVVTFTTIGYGDLVPDTKAGRVFTCFFALSGVACLGIALGVVGNNFIAAQEQAMERAKILSMKRVLDLFSAKPNSTSQAGLQEEATRRSTTEMMDSEERTKSPWQRLWTHLREFSLVVFVLLLFASLIADDPGINKVNWELGNALYYTAITATTVGYGQFSPQTQKGRLVAVIFIPLAVGAMGHWLSSVASWIIERRQRDEFRKQFESRELSLHDLEIMDQDGDGEVSRAEFLEFMLVAMNKVDRDLIDELRKSFARMDKNGSGTLSKADLIANARRRLKSARQKLELAQYKRVLLQEQEV